MGKSKTKVAKKNLLKTIKKGLIKELKESTAQVVKSSKKLDRLIDKSSGKLVKKLGGKLKLNKPVKVKSPEKAPALAKPDNTTSKISVQQTKSPVLAKRPSNQAPASSNPIQKKTAVKKNTGIRKPAKEV